MRDDEGFQMQDDIQHLKSQVRTLRDRIFELEKFVEAEMRSRATPTWSKAEP